MRALCALMLVACAPARVMTTAPVAAQLAPEIEVSTPEAEGMSSDELLKLATWLRDNPKFPIFSILISRNGKLIFELYTSKLGREDAHYLMSVTKSVLSALIGIAIDKHLISGPDATIADLLPRALFDSDGEQARFKALTLKQVLGMQGLDAPDPPRLRTPEATARYEKFWLAPSRLKVALQQPLLSDQTPFQYNDCTPTLAIGALHEATKKSALEFAEEALFKPLGFRHYEWMHRDPSGLESGGYGLRLRPIDMQKLGLLYLNGGVWRGRRLISQSWIDRSFEPWNRSVPTSEKPDYGWFWWTYYLAPGWTARVANGWRGQRIAVFPEQHIVVTMTGSLEDGSEGEFFSQLITKIVKPSLEKQRGAPNAVTELNRVLKEVQSGPLRFQDFIEYRMVPSITLKQPR